MSLIYGIAINNADYKVKPTINGKRTTCPYYRTWFNMIQRCYSTSFHKKWPTYAECSVTNEWLHFLTFKIWMEKQDWKGKHLDKDIMIPGNKIYSPDTCVFVSPRINTLLVDCKASTGKHPKGVRFNKADGKFIASMRVFGKSRYLGRFNDPDEASKAYRKAKRLHLLETAYCESDFRVKWGLYRHSLLY